MLRINEVNNSIKEVIKLQDKINKKKFSNGFMITKDITNNKFKKIYKESYNNNEKSKIIVKDINDFIELLKKQNIINNKNYYSIINVYFNNIIIDSFKNYFTEDNLEYYLKNYNNYSNEPIIILSIEFFNFNDLLINNISKIKIIFTLENLKLFKFKFNHIYIFFDLLIKNQTEYFLKIESDYIFYEDLIKLIKNKNY